MNIEDIVNEIEDSYSDQQLATRISLGLIDFDKIKEQRRKNVADILGETASGFRKVSKEYMTDQMIGAEIKRIHKDFEVQTELQGCDYYELSSIMLATSPSPDLVARRIHPEFYDKKLLKLALDAKLDFSTINLKKINVDSEFANELVKNSILSVKLLPDISVVTDESLLQGLKKNQRANMVLVGIGRKHLLKQAVAQGMWTPGADRPENLSDAIKQRMKLKTGLLGVSAYLDTFITSFPIQDVASLMKTHARKKVLLKLYSGDELLETFPEDHFIKGIVLEDQLGL